MSVFRVYSISFTPFSQCSTWLSFTIMVAVLKSFLLKGFFSGAGIRSYNEPNFLLPFTPSLASGCLSSSRIWNSQPIAEPSPLFKSGLTKYLTPLFAPSVILKSTVRMKFLYLRVVTISPPLADSAPPLFITFRIPSSIFHPFSGKAFNFAPLQPLLVLPSQSRAQPSLASRGDMVLAIIFRSGASCVSGVW